MSTTKNKQLKIAVLCDPHFAGDSPQPSAELFGEISKKADVLLVGGDITGEGTPEEAEIAASRLSASTVPVLAVLGNHDYESGYEAKVKKTLHDAGIFMLEHQPYVLGEVGFVGTKGFGGGFGEHLLVPFGEPLIKRFVEETVEETYKLETQLKSLNTKKKVALLHYAPVTDTIRGEAPEIYPFMGCSRLAETIDRYDINLVFHGHSHNGAYHGRTARGIPVYNCSMDLLLKQPPKRAYAIFEI